MSTTQAAGAADPRPTTTDHLTRALYSLIGVVLIGLGAAILRVGGVGVDPYTAMNNGLADLLGLSLGVTQLAMNLLWFVPVLIWGRHMIGIGTVLNMVLVGFFIDLFSGMLQPLVPGEPTPGVMALLFAIGIVVFDIGASAYIAAGMGTAPYDAIAPMIVDRTGWAYQRVRVPQDLAVLVIAVLQHGPVGIGTVFTAFLNGPLIQFFQNRMHQPLIARLTRGRPAVRHHEHAGRPGDATDLL